jgi:hypothetical protein
VKWHGSAEKLAARRIRPPYIQYADLADLILMLDIKPGGGVMDTVNEAQKLIERKDKPWRVQLRRSGLYTHGVASPVQIPRAG